MKKEIAAVILAGGKGSRAGGVLKTEIIVEGKTIFSRIEEVFSGIFEQIIISTNSKINLSPYDKYLQVTDIIEGMGPLGGIYSAMCSATGSTAVFVFAGDMPFPDRELIIKMIDHFRNNPVSALIPQVNSYFEPLHGIYSISILPEIEAYLRTEKNRSVNGLLRRVSADLFFLDDSEKVRKAFTNINSPGDLFY